MGSGSKLFKKVASIATGKIILDEGKKLVGSLTGANAIADSSKAQADAAEQAAVANRAAAEQQAQAVRDQTAAAQQAAAQQQQLALQTQNDAAANSARNAALNATREQASASAAEAAAAESTPVVSLGPTQDSQSTRRRYNASRSTGGATTGSIRL